MPKILIAEDNVILADLLEYYLISQGFDVCGIASTVDEAVALADLHDPDIAVLDFRLGAERASEIRARTRNKNNMAILFVSGDPLDGKLSEADGEAYLQKPYGMHELLQALRIVREIKMTRGTLPRRYPKGFHLIRNTPDTRRRSA